MSAEIVRSYSPPVRAGLLPIRPGASTVLRLAKCRFLLLCFARSPQASSLMNILHHPGQLLWLLRHAPCSRTRRITLPSHRAAQDDYRRFAATAGQRPRTTHRKAPPRACTMTVRRIHKQEGTIYEYDHLVTDLVTLPENGDSSVDELVERSPAQLVDPAAAPAAYAAPARRPERLGCHLVTSLGTLRIRRASRWLATPPGDECGRVALPAGDHWLPGTPGHGHHP